MPTLNDLLYQITDIELKVPDKVLSLINENFKILELKFQGMNNLINDDGSIGDIDITIQELAEMALMAEFIVTWGLDAEKPKIFQRKGRWFYWATDTEKLYLLMPVGEEL